jgi:hypothetical protein
VSLSLSFDCWRSDEPAATDPVEKRTWAGLRLLVKGQCASQFWDRHIDAASETIYVPTFPLAQWFVGNWWALFFEPCRTETPPPEAALRFATQRRWVDRHCLRAAETGLFLPYLHIYGNGPGVSVYWSEDDPQTYPSAPGHFLYSGLAQFDTRQATTAVGEFVSKVLGWCDGVSDARIDRLRSDWDAITGADEQEQAFCRAAGRLGLDPYAIGDWTAGLAEFLSTGLGVRIEDAIVEDLLESVDPMSASLSWEWASTTERTFGLSAGSMPQIIAGSGFRTAKDQGYFVARQLRNLVGLAPDQPIDEIGGLARAAGGATFSFEQHNHLPTRAVLAAVGWHAGHEAVLAGPRPSHPNTQRFLEARGLFQAMIGCRRGARLITHAHTWDQQAARSFAAELLAPQEALAEHASPDAGPDERLQLQEELADRFKVSTEVVRLQLQNQGVWRDFDD